MRYPSSLQPTFFAILAIGFFCNSTFAQGTATGMFTSHSVGPGLIVNIGDAASPISIDLDPTGLPWSKGFFDDRGFTSGGGTLDNFETILNAGTEAWGDWHEHLIGDPASASAPSFWSAAVSLEVNGSPITFSATGIGTKDLWFDNFSLPVLPGDVLTIHKQADIFSNTAGIDMIPLFDSMNFRLRS